MDWPTAGVAIAAALGTSAVAVSSLIHQREEAVKDRDHDAEMRRQERRSAAYVEMITALEHQQMQVDRTAPIFVQGGEPDPPPSLTDEELWRLNSLAGVIASDALGALIQEWTKHWREFFAAVDYLQQVQLFELSHPLPSETEAAFGVTAQKQWEKVDAQRKNLRDELLAIGKHARSEL